MAFEGYEQKLGSRVEDIDPVLEWVPGRGPDDETEESQAPKTAELALVDLKVNDAIKVVKETLMPDLLKEWQTAEKRTGVLKAIEKQLEKVEFPSEKAA